MHDETNPAFRRAYLRLMLDKVVVASDSITLSGPKAALAAQLAANNPLAPSLAPTFAHDWRAAEGEDAYWRLCLERP